MLGIGSLLAVIFGHHARRQIREVTDLARVWLSRASSLGYVGLAGIAILVIFLLAAAANISGTLRPL